MLEILGHPSDIALVAAKAELLHVTAVVGSVWPPAEPWPGMNAFGFVAAVA